MECKWSRINIEKLIVYIQENACLYSIRCTDYMNRAKKAMAFAEIQKKMATEMVGVTQNDIQKKWKNLRSQYMRELRLIKNSKKSGSGINEVYQTKLWCFDQLSFLEGHVATRQSQDNIEMPSSSTTSTYTGAENSSSSVNDEPSKKPKKKSKQYNQMHQEFSQFEQMMHKKKSSRKYAWLGTLVANKMEEIDNDKQHSAALEVQTVLQRFIDESNQRTPPSLATASSSGKDLLQLSMQGVFDEDDFC